jgi:glycosyltransferase involved in cell wall biosynthesis
MLGGGIEPDEVAGAVRLLRADVVHAHNLHPLFGWRALAAAQATGARTVLQLHNFRLFCAIAVAYRDGAPCYRCHGRDTLPGLRLRCRGSATEAAVYAAGLWRQQPRLFRHSDRFVVLSEAHGARLRELGLPGGNAVTLPNFVPAERFASRSVAGSVGRFALAAGRLVEEKGFDTAIGAARAAGVPLVIAGEGPDEVRLRRLADAGRGGGRAAGVGRRGGRPADGAEVRFTGLLTPAALGELRRQAAAVLVPSRCEEACPYAVLDAYADGVPVLASDRGGLPELVLPGAALPADDQTAWAEALAALWSASSRERDELGERVLAHARERLGEDRYYEGLMSVYSAEP